MMERPDQKLFDSFANHFFIFDPQISIFAKQSGFNIYTNLGRNPNRVLKRRRLAQEIIEIGLDGHWRSMQYREELPCAFDICSYYENSDSYRIHKIGARLGSFTTKKFDYFMIDEFLKRSLELFESWTPECIVSLGAEIPNLKRIYNNNN